MIQLWSTWNFSWFLAAYNKLVPFDGALKSSIVVTSLVGGYLIYIYPRKVTLRFFNYKVKPSYFLLVICDLICHQGPMLYLINSKINGGHDLIESDKCGARIIAPFAGWILFNYLSDVKLNKLYGVTFNKLIISGAGVFVGYSILHHLKK